MSLSVVATLASKADTDDCDKRKSRSYYGRNSRDDRQEERELRQRKGHDIAYILTKLESPGAVLRNVVVESQAAQSVKLGASV